MTPIFQKESGDQRLVCYCFGITAGDIRHELSETGRTSVVERVSRLVSAGRCACEVKNPQGTCCLGNLAAVARAIADQPPTE